jgi:hypothetical protein
MDRFVAALLAMTNVFYLMAGLDPAIQNKRHGRLDARVKPAHEGHSGAMLP